MARSKRRNRRRIYARQSWRKEESISIETQIEHATLHCQRNGLEIVGEPVVDVNLSGRSFKNRSVGPLIQSIADGEADGIVVWKWSRWGRSLIESLLFLAELKQANGVLESATEPMDASTAAGKFSVTQMLAIAEFESDRIGDMWKDAKRSMVFKRGLPPTGGARLGYRYGGRAYRQDPVTGLFLANAYEQYIAGASFSDLVKEAREKGVLTTQQKAMTLHSLQWSMESGFAAGFIKLDEPQKLLNDEEMDTFDIDNDQQLLLPGSWDALIEPDVWSAFRAARTERKMQPPRKRNAVHQLSGFVKCAGCGRQMMYRSDRDRWTCASGRLKDTIPCPIRVTIDNDELVAAVRHWLAVYRDGDPNMADELVRQQMEVQGAAGDIEVLEKDLARLEQGMKNLIQLTIDGVFTASEVAGKKAELKAETEQTEHALIAARRRKAVHSMPTANSFGAIEADWDSMKPNMTNRGLKTVLHDVLVYPFRDEVRVRLRGTWQRTMPLPVAEAPDLDFDEGRTCLGCKTWKPRSEFYVRTRGSQLMSRCKTCKAEAHAAWRVESQAAGSVTSLAG